MSKTDKKESGDVIQLGILPEHTVRLTGEEKLAGESLPRLQCVITIRVKDRHTGGELTRRVPYDCSAPDKVHSALVSVMKHPRLKDDIEAFVRQREG